MKYRAFIKKNMEKPARDSVFRRILRGERPPLDRGALRRLLSALLLLSVLANSFGFAMDDFAVADALHVEQEDVGGAEEEIASDTDPAATEVNAFALGKVSGHQDEDDGYVYELAGAKKVLFSAIFDRVKLPVLLESVEIVRPLDKLDAAAMEKERADLKKRIAERKEQEKKNKPEEPEKESSKKKDKKDKKEEKTVFLSVLAKDGDFEITVLKDFSEAGLAVHTADDVLFIKLTNRIASMVDSTAAELDDYVLGDAYAGSSSDQAPADDASAYAFELGDASVALSEIIARTGMPVALADIELVGQSGSAGEGELLAIEPTEDDYRISAQADFDEARLEVYTAQDEYVVRLTDGRVAAAPEATEETPETSEPASDEASDAADAEPEAGETEPASDETSDAADAEPEAGETEPASDETSDTADAEPEAGESEPASDEASDTADAEPEAGESEPGTETDEEPTGFEIEEGAGEETATDTEEEQTEVEIDDEKPTSVENEEQTEVEDSPAQDADETEASRNAADPSLIVIGPSEGAKAPGADAQEGDDDASVAEANAALQSTASHDTANLHLSLSGDAAATVSLRATEVEVANHQRLVEAYNIESSRDCEGVAVALARLPHMAEGEYLALYGIAGGALSESPALDHLEVGDSHTFAVDAWEGFALVKLGLSVYQLIPAEPVDDATIELRGTMPVGASMEVESASGYGDAGDDVLMACDITIQDVEGADFQPLSGDPVEVTVRSDAIRQALFSGSELEVYSYSNGEEHPEDVEIVRAVGNSVTFAAETFDTVYAIREVVLEKSLTASDGNTYHISVAYDTASGLPANAELAVQEITESDPAYADYVAQSAAKVGGEAKDVAFARAFDITLLDPDTGREYQPNKDVKVSITLLNEAMDEAQIDVVHFGKEAELMDSSVSGETVEFMTDGFSVYVVVSTVLEKKLTASDGNEYLVTVTYDTTCGIPAGAELIVSEIREGDAGYDAYMAASAEKLGETPENLALARAFDIALRNPETGEEYQPNKDVTVSIRLLKENLSDYENIDVVHFPGEADDGADVMDTTLKGETIEFETDGFSVYVLIGEKPSYDPADDKVKSLSDLSKWYNVPSIGGKGFFLSYGSAPNYCTNELNTNNAFIEETNISNASKWYFEAQGTANTYYIYTYVEGVKKYMKQTSAGQNTMELTPDRVSATPFVLEQVTSTSKFWFKVSTEGRWLQHSKGGNGIRLWNDKNNTDNSQISITYAYLYDDGSDGDLSELVRSAEYKIGNNAYANVTTTNEASPARVDMDDKAVTVRLGFDVPASSIKGNTELFYILPGVDGIAFSEGYSGGNATATIGNTVYTLTASKDANNSRKLKLEYSDALSAAKSNFNNTDNARLTVEVPLVITNAAIEDGVIGIVFGNGVVLYADTPHNPKIVDYQITSPYDREHRTITYRLTVTAEGNVNSPVVIRDATGDDNSTIGTALRFKEGSYTLTRGGSTGDLTTLTRFPLIIESMQNGDVITVDYTVEVDPDKVAVSGAATQAEVGNRVVLTNEDNDSNIEGDDQSSIVGPEGSSVVFSNISVVAESSDSGIDDNDEPYQDVTWEITANTQDAVKLLGTVSSTLDTNGLSMDFVGEGITVKIGENDPTTIGWNKLTRTDSRWDWTIPLNSGSVPLTITYKTRFGLSGVTERTTVTNRVQSHMGTANAQGTVNPDEPFIKKTHVSETEQEGMPVHTFKVIVGGVKDESLTDGKLVITDTLDTAYASLWKLYGSPEVSVPGVPGATASVSATCDGGTITFTVTPARDANNHIQRFYMLTYSITPVGWNSLCMAAVNNGCKLSFANSASVTSGNTHAGLSATSAYGFDYKPISKSLGEVDGYWANYTVEVNPDKLTMNNNSPLTIEDDPGSNQEIEASSVKAINVDTNSDISDEVTYNPATGTFTIPDGTHVLLSYKARLIGTEGEEIVITNKATLKWQTFSIYDTTSSTATVPGESQPGEDTLLCTYYFLDGDETIYWQTVASIDELIIPQPTPKEEQEFAGWYDADDTLYDFEGAKIEEGVSAVYLHSEYKYYIYVNFHDQYDTATRSYPVAYTRRVELPQSGDAMVKISDLSVTYRSVNQEIMVFRGWSKEPVQKPGQGGDKIITDDEDGWVVVNADQRDFYPVFLKAYRLVFVSGKTGSGASYVPAASYCEDEWLKQEDIPVPTWGNYTFEGWWTTEDYQEGTEVFNATTKLKPEFDRDGITVETVNPETRRLRLTDNATLYAKWSAEQSIPWKIIIWKQKTTDMADATDKTYDFVASIEKTAALGTTVSVEKVYKTVSGLVSENITGIDEYSYEFGRCDGPTPVNDKGYTVLNVYYNRRAGATDPTPSTEGYSLRFLDSMEPMEGVTWTGNNLPIEYDGNGGRSKVQYNASIKKLVPDDPSPAIKGYSGQEVFTFSGWYADSICSTKVFFDQESYNQYQYSKVLYETMPCEDLTIYAGWSAAEWYIVQIDPNYGAFNGTGGTWFWETFDGEQVREYTQVTRDYVKSSSGQTYYAKRDRAYYGYSGNEYDPNEPEDRNAYYTNVPGEATEDTTFEYSPGTYTYVGWYEVNADGTETPYDFSRRVDHDLSIRLHWKKAGVYYLEYDAGEGLLDNGRAKERSEQTYSDCSSITLTRTAIPGSNQVGSTFVGWRKKNSDDGRIYKPGSVFTLSSDDAVLVGGKEVVTLVAVYKAPLETTSITYDANGGTVNDGADFGEDDEHTPLQGTVAEDRKTATVSGLADRARIILSSGEGFTFAQGVRLVGWRDEAKKRHVPGSSYTVSTSKSTPTTFKAIWQTNVAYHLNDADGKEDWGGFAQLPSTTYYYNHSDKTYNRVAYIGDTVSEPAAAPTYRDDEKLFRYWATRSGDPGSYNYEEYDFAQPVAGALDLYACWGDPEVVRIHAVDASAEALAEHTDWTVENVVVISEPAGKGIQVKTTPTALSANSHVKPGDAYAFAFIAVSKSLSAVSENKAVTGIRYNGVKKCVEVLYAGETDYRPLKDGEELYFVYYQKKQANIGYDSMNQQGGLTVINGIPSSAPRATDLDYTGGGYAVYDMAEKITAPLAWVNGDPVTYPYYAFALGAEDVTNASKLTLISSISNDDENRPVLALRNTWRGFEYTTTFTAQAGSDQKIWTNWKRCGYNVQLYVLYYDKRPTVVTFNVKTVGLQADVTGQAFNFNYVITDIVNGEESAKYDYHAETDDYITLHNGESYSTVLFTSGDSLTQRVTISQNTVDDFTVAVNGEPQHPAEGETSVSWSVTPDETTIGSTVEVTFTNTRASIPVEAHVALVEDSGVICRDSKRSRTPADTRFNLRLGQSATLLTALPATGGERTVGVGDEQTTEPYDGLFVDNTDTYAFGVILYAPAAEEGHAIIVREMGFTKVAYLPVAEGSNIYELVLQDDQENKLANLDDNQIYYLYYPKPVIKYVKAVEKEGEAKYTLEPVIGLEQNTETGELEAADDRLTYSLASISVNGKPVTQNQRLELPKEGLTISQSGNNFRMPPVMDDGSTLAERYLTYSYLLAGDADMTEISEEDLAVGEGLTLRLKILNYTLEYSYNGKDWAPMSIAEGKCPTIYAIYAERGYDLLITKTVNVAQSGENPIFTGKYFTITIASDKIKAKPETEGEEGEVEFIPANPEVEGSKNELRLKVKDGSRVKLIGMAKGEYSITEGEKENYVLTAQAGAIVGGTMSNITLPDQPLTLDTEKCVKLVNTPKAICKIHNTVFYTLKDAVEYAAEMPDRTATIEMLTDYTMPLLDAVDIPAGYNITIATSTDINGEQISDPWEIKRDTDMADVPLFDNKGTLTFAHIIIDGASINATAPMIRSAGKLTVNESATLRNAINANNGGAIYATAGDIVIQGNIQDNKAANGGAIYCAGDGNITVSDSGRIANNIASSGNGGAIYYAGNGEINLSGQGGIAENTANQGNGGAIYAQNGTINISQRITIEKNTAKNGGAIYTPSGSVTVNPMNENNAPTIKGNYATNNGGAFWIGTGTLAVFGGTFQGNGKKANSYTQKGGAIYVDSGTLTLSNTITTSSDDVSGGDGEPPTTTELVAKPIITGNFADNGAAIFVNNGNATFTGGEVKQNTVNGSGTIATGGAVGVGGTSVRLYFSDAAQVTGNKYGSGNNALDCNVFLDQDTDSVINTSGLTKEQGKVGIYVPNKFKEGKEYLYKNRGGVGGLFGVYTENDADVSGFSNDRWENLYALKNETTRKIFWTAPILIAVRYLKSFSTAFPDGGSDHNPTLFYPTGEEMAFSAVAEAVRGNLAASAIYATTLRLNRLPTEADWRKPQNPYEDYLTKLVWRDNMWQVQKRDGTVIPLVEKEEQDDGSFVDLETMLVVYFADPAFVSIENNTEYPLDITEIKVKMPGKNNETSVMNSATVVGCGLVFARDAVIQPDLLPVEMSDDKLTLAAKGGSISVLIPGGQNIDFTLKGSVVGMPATETVNLRMNGTDSKVGTSFDEKGKTKNNTDTYEIIFGGDKYICKIWAPNRFDTQGEAEAYCSEQALNSNLIVQDGNKYVVRTNTLYANGAEAKAAAKTNCATNYGLDCSGEADVCKVGEQWAVISRREVPFSTMRGAVYFAKENQLRDVTIEMIVDYLMPGSDVVKITDREAFATAAAEASPKDVPYIAVDGIEKITFTTATKGRYKYEGTGRASISRGNGNTKDPVITVNIASKDANDFANVVIRNLDFDGKALTGTCDGGALKTKNCKVDIENANFKSFISKNGGAIFIAYGDDKKISTVNYYYFDDYTGINDNDTVNLNLKVKNANFTSCKSETNDGRAGGGAIWMNGKKMELEDCSFTGCSATDQGGAVFHRIESQEKDNYKPYPYCAQTKTVVKGTCTFTSCEANAAGGIESDAHTVEITGSTFTQCKALKRGGGGINVYIHDSADSELPTQATFTDCTFIGCTAMRDGGGLCCATLHTTLNNCTFRDCKATGKASSNENTRGGGVYFKNTKAVDAYVYGCTFERCLVTNETIQATDKEKGKGYEGGAIACNAAKLTIDKYGNKKTKIQGCTSISNGGAIYKQGNGATEISDTEIEGCIAAYCGGGFYTTAGTTVTFTNSSIRSCKANVLAGPKDNNWGGGGIYYAVSNKLTLIGTTVQGNSALTQNSYGGGVYAKKDLEIQNSYIRNNSLPEAVAEHGAGVYIGDAGTLTIGDAHKAEDVNYCDNSEIKGNVASGNQVSNLRLPEDTSGQNKNCVKVNCNLGPKENEGGVIGVVNAKVVGTQFGQSPFSKSGTEGWRPTGLGDQDAVFQSDNSNLHGIIDRSVSNNQKIIWGGPPICKLTDDAGRDLYFSVGNPAIFDRLDTEGSGQVSSPFNLFRGTTMMKLQYKDGTQYSGNKYCLKMLVESYELSEPVNVYFGSNIEVTFTTAGKTDNDADYPYGGTPERDGTCRAMLTSAGDHSLLVMNQGNLVLKSIILDGKSHAAPVVQVNGGKLELGTKAILQNAKNNGEIGNGGGAYINGGEFQIRFGTVRNCIAKNGGGVYVNDGKFTFSEGGSITRCEAIADGGGVYVNGGEFLMDGGIIGYSAISSDNRNKAVRGGGVFVADGKTMTMAGGTIRNNYATNQGGGIAVGGNSAELYFSGYVQVTGNTCQASKLGDKTCNVELNYSANDIIHTGPEAALASRANIGVYVTGEDENDPPFSTHGQEGQVFGTFTKTNQVNTLYCFTNDRNFLKGGLVVGQDVTSSHDIHWIKIFKLLIENQVEVSENAEGDAKIAEHAKFGFTVKLDNGDTTSQVRVKNIYDDIRQEGADGRYGAIPFNRINNGETEITATFELSSNEAISAQNLPAGLRYWVEETGDSRFEIVPVNTRTGYIGEMTEYTEDPYTARLVFKNILPVCKITDSEGVMLYQEHEVRSGNSSKSVYSPAVFTELTGDNGAFKALEGRFYYDSHSLMKEEDKGKGLQIQMLVTNYTLKEWLTVPEGVKLTLTTASSSAGKHPYRGTGNTASITRAYNNNPMLVNYGDLTLKNITLDGAKINTFYASQDGGIVKVNGTGALTVDEGATLQNSRTTANGGAVYLANGASMTVNGGSLTGNNAMLGGAVYAVSGASMTFTRGSIEKNLCSTNGAGVYLEQGAELRLSGSPNFGDTGISQGSIRNTNGNMLRDNKTYLATNGRMNYTEMRQDIFIAGYEDAYADSLVITGDFDDSVKAGSIWVWAEKEGHYKAEKQFAKVDDSATVQDSTLLAFRNARVDEHTDANKTGSYLHGESDGGKNVRWNSLAVCKLTDANDIILYQRDDSNMLIPAVYSTVKEGFQAAIGDLYKKDGQKYEGNALKLKLLVDYTLTEEDKNIASSDVNLTFTTAEIKTELSQQETQEMAGNGDTYFYNSDNSSSKIATLSRGNDDDLGASMIIVNSGSLTLTNITLDGKNKQTSAKGGIVSVANGAALTIETGATLQNASTTGDGGAVYVAAGGIATVSGGTLDGNSAANGAGIYLSANGKLYLSGNPSFGGAGMNADESINPSAGNHSTSALSAGAKNGGKNYTLARQDIFLEGTGAPLNSLVISGALTDPDDNTKAMPNGSIWVWASGDNEDVNHYMPLKQFAVLSDDFTGEVSEATYKAFRNARPDSDTNWSGEYLTGQAGEDIEVGEGDAKVTYRCVYWTGGFDFAFRKISSEGTALDGATFTLYAAEKDSEDETVLVKGDAVNQPVASEEIAETAPKSIKVKTVSGETETVASQTLYGDGLVVFEKVSPGTYFLEETVFPKIDGLDYLPVKDDIQYKVDLAGDGTYTISQKDDAEATWVPVSNTTLTMGDDTVQIPTILNLSPKKRKVILRKVNSSNVPLSGMRFKIYRADGSEVVTTDRNDDGYYVSGDSGVYFIGTLNDGTYTLVELDASDAEHTFTLVVGDTMVRSLTEVSPGAGE